MLRLNVVFGLLAASILLLTATAEGRQDGRSVETPVSNTFLQSLTEIERAWLRDHPVIRVVQAPDWPPVEFADERGEPSGMTADYLSLVEQRLGVKFERVRNLSWQEAYARLRRWEIDMTTSVTVTPERTEFWAFTKPYMEILNVIFTDVNVTYIADIRELAGMKVAVVDSYAVSDWIPRDFPDIQIIKVKNVQEGLEKLQGREVSAYIGDMLVGGYFLTKLKMTTLKIAGKTPYVNAQSMAVRKDWATLAGILDKALDTISEAERNNIYRRWLPIRYEQGFDYRMLWRALAVFALILLGLLFWIRKLAREISYRKKAEAELIKSQLLLQSSIESPKDIIIFSIDKQYQYLYFNIFHKDVMAHAYGKYVKLGMNSLEYITNDDDRRKSKINYDHALAGESYTTIEEYGDLDRHFYETRYNPIVNDKNEVIGATVFSTNITERKRAELALKKSEQRLRRFYESGMIGVIYWNLNGEITDANDKFLEMVGYSREELDSGKIDWTGMTPLEFRYLDENSVRELMETGINKIPFEKEYIRKDGTRMPILIAGAMLDSGLTNGVAFVLDITERKRAEEKIRNSLAEKEVLLKEVHHRVKNNLAIIIGLIKMQEIKASNEMVTPLLQELEGRIHAMAQVHEVLHKSADLARIDLQNYIEKMIVHIRSQFGSERGIHFRVQAAGADVNLDIAIPCGLILNELITNAYKHAFPDDKPRAGEDNCEIKVIVEQEGGVLTLTVANNGIGLPADLDLEKSETLGLRLVKMLCQQINGSIELDRSAGTAFRLKFPLAEKIH